jgi:uncharacterized membrane protein
MDTLRRLGWMSVIAAVLLAAYLLFVLYGLFSPSDDPQRGMANGFLTFVALILVSLEALLWFAVTRNKVWLIRVVFVIAILPGLSPIARVIYVLTHGA